MNTPNTEISSTKTRPRVHIEPLPFDPKGASPAKAIKKENPEKVLSWKLINVFSYTLQFFFFLKILHTTILNIIS